MANSELSLLEGVFYTSLERDSEQVVSTVRTATCRTFFVLVIFCAGTRMLLVVRNDNDVRRELCIGI